MNFLILMGLCIVTAIIYSTVQTKDHRSFNAFEVGSTPSDNNVINSLVIFVYVALPRLQRGPTSLRSRADEPCCFSSGLIVFQNIVPISLYISVSLDRLLSVEAVCFAQHVVVSIRSSSSRPSVILVSLTRHFSCSPSPLTFQIQAFFIYQDREMYYEPLDTTCVPKTWDISDEYEPPSFKPTSFSHSFHSQNSTCSLGQIEYIFSDKTGTLTQNVMEFSQ